MDLHDALDEFASMIENARSMPMSASCMINRADAQRLVNRVRDLLPQELQHAQLLLREREAVIEEGRQEAERILSAARAQRAALLGEPGAAGPYTEPYDVPDQRGAHYPPAHRENLPAHADHPPDHPPIYQPAYQPDADRAATVAAINEADSIRREADEYVDQQLATLEVILNKALTSVQRGRDRLPGRGDAAT